MQQGTERDVEVAANLRHRVSALERALGALNTTSNITDTTLSQKINTLQETIGKLSLQLTHLSSFKDKLNRIEGTPEAVEQISFAPTAGKVSILTSYEKDALLLQKDISTLEKELPLLDADLKPLLNHSNSIHALEHIHLDQLEATSLLDRKCAAFLENYNNTINLLSLQFVLWDQMLQEWENQ